MQHSLGRVARGLILLGVVLGHGLLLILPGPSHPPLAGVPDLQVMLEPAPRSPTLTAPLPEKPAPAIAAKPRVSVPSPRPVLSAPVVPLPTAIQSREVNVAVMPASPPGTGVAVEKNTEMPGVGGAAKPVTSDAAAPVVRIAASCDTRLLDSDYPASARRDEREGRVLVQAHVLQSGQVQESRVVKSSGFAVLDQAALRASAHWRCTPARQNGEAVESQVAVPVVFRLDD